MATVVLATTLLVGCGGGSAGLKGTTVSMPVLWAGTGSNGEITSGIERAKVTVGNVPGTTFGLDLNGIEAKKAGPQWRAATATAAAVATIASATDPTEIDIDYSITGPIDGPSGGAMLTVGTIAAIRRDTLAGDITMTGTISPDGTIGLVGGIPAKLRAAASAGFRRVLLPTANLVASGEPTTTDMVEYGRSLGLEVRGVDLVSVAYEAFTGNSLGTTATALPPFSTLSAPVRAAATTTTEALVDRLDIESQSTTAGGVEAGIVTRDLAAARRALAAGDVARAHGLAVDGYTVLRRAIGAALTNARIASGGVTSARDAMRADIAVLRTRAAEVLRTGSQVQSADAVVQLATPFALGWATYSDAVLAGIDAALADGSIGPAGYTTTGGAIEEQRASIEVFQPDALLMARTAPNPSVTTVRPASEFLSGYTDFLVRAGQANTEYYGAVVSRGRQSRTDANGTPVFNLLALEAMGSSTDQIPSGVQAIDDEIRQSALAITYFVIGTGLVSNTRQTGISGAAIGVDAVSTIDIPGLVDSVVEGSRLVADYAQALAARSIDAGSSIWSAQWGLATAEALNGSGRDATGEVIAQNELWYDVIGMSVLWAATRP